MNIIQGIILGIVQGIAEFLPISSSGHLILTRSIIGVNNQENFLLFDILLHLATLIVILSVFWKDWTDIIKNPFRSKKLLYIIISALPAALVVFLFKDEVKILLGGKFLGFSFIITAILLLIIDIIYKNNNNSNNITAKSSIIMGLLQILGIFPGISRSGSTIFGGIVAKLSKVNATKFSFMMSAPAVLGSLLLEIKKLLTNEISVNSIYLTPTIFAMICAIIFGFISVKFMLKYIERIKLKYFSIYLAIVGLIVIFTQTFVFMG